MKRAPGAHPTKILKIKSILTFSQSQLKKNYLNFSLEKLRFILTFLLKWEKVKVILILSFLVRWAPGPARPQTFTQHSPNAVFHAIWEVTIDVIESSSIEIQGNFVKPLACLNL